MSNFFKRNQDTESSDGQFNNFDAYDENPTKTFLVSVAIVVAIVLLGLAAFLGGRWVYKEYQAEEIVSQPATQVVDQTPAVIVEPPVDISVPVDQSETVVINIDPTTGQASQVSATGILPEGIAWQTLCASLFLAIALGLSHKLSHKPKRL